MCYDTIPPFLLPLHQFQTTNGYLYVWSKEILPLNHTVVIGETTIAATASDETSGIERVEFYVDDELKETVTEGSFEWLLDERMLFNHIITAVAYDTAGNMATVEQEIWIFNL